MRAWTFALLLGSLSAPLGAQQLPVPGQSGWVDELSVILAPILDALPRTEPGFREAFGEPQSRDEREAPLGGTISALTYDGLYVRFFEGKLFEAGITKGTWVPDSAAIQIGMPPEEVESLLGKPAPSDVGGILYWIDETYSLWFFGPPDGEVSAIAISLRAGCCHRDR